MTSLVFLIDAALGIMLLVFAVVILIAYKKYGDVGGGVAVLSVLIVGGIVFSYLPPGYEAVNGCRKFLDMSTRECVEHAKHNYYWLKRRNERKRYKELYESNGIK